MGGPRTVVISDIHVGAGALDDCDAELERCLIEFVSELSTSDGSIELVINGDFLDFVQAPPLDGSDLQDAAPDGQRLCFTEGQSAAKLIAIRDAHPEIFRALGTVLASGPSRTLVVLPGNHDADLFWPAVRSLFGEALDARPAARAQLAFHLECVYRPRHAPRAWIEHGHQHDDLNSFFIGNEPAWKGLSTDDYKESLLRAESLTLRMLDRWPGEAAVERAKNALRRLRLVLKIYGSE